MAGEDEGEEDAENELEKGLVSARHENADKAQKVEDAEKVEDDT